MPESTESSTGKRTYGGSARHLQAVEASTQRIATVNARKQWRKTMRTVVFLNRLMKAAREELDEDDVEGGAAAGGAGGAAAGGVGGATSGSGGEKSGKSGGANDGGNGGGNGGGGPSPPKSPSSPRRRRLSKEVMDTVSATEEQIRRAEAKRRFKKAANGGLLALHVCLCMRVCLCLHLLEQP